MKERLEGRVALVTGGSAGIGLASAGAFVEEGAVVYITGRRQVELDAAVAMLGAQASGIRADMSKPKDIEAAYDRIANEQGRLDILFANAGLYEFARLDDITEDHIDRILDINIKGLVLAVQRALPLMRAGGSIVLTGSVAVGKGSSALSVYAASKAAVRSFARSWANELKDRGIRVNVISPGPIDTPGLVDLAGGPDGLAELKRNFEASVPMGRLGRAEEVARAAVFLASDDASFITGIDLGVDGGKGQI
jgi:NAD(P)-dependent dehydrogenase (short-subunit alcohol dehydrogenase family)